MGGRGGKGLTGTWEVKALNVARNVRHLEAEAAPIDEAKHRMEARAKAALRQAGWLKGYLKGELERTGLKPQAPDLGPPDQCDSLQPESALSPLREAGARCDRGQINRY